MAKSIQADYGDVAPKAGGGMGGLLPIKDANGKRSKYLGKITAAEPKKSAANPWVQYTLKVIGGEFDGQELKYQSVVFLPKEHEYAGISLHFLKCVREEFEGKFNITPDNWVGKHVFFYVKHEDSTKLKDDGEPYVNNKVAGVEVVDIPTLIELGEYEDASEAPDWLQEAQAAMDGKPKEEKKAPAKTAPKAEVPEGSSKAAAKANQEKKNGGEKISPTAPCDVCERPFKNHAGLKHEFVEGVPF